MAGMVELIRGTLETGYSRVQGRLVGELDSLHSFHIAMLRRLGSANSDMISGMISEKNWEITSEFMSEITSAINCLAKVL